MYPLDLCTTTSVALVFVDSVYSQGSREHLEEFERVDPVHEEKESLLQPRDRPDPWIGPCTDKKQKIS
ncbi:unnamed protein product [Prunus brigantina]